MAVLKYLPINVTLAQVEKVIAAAKAKAFDIIVSMNITVVDRSENLVAFTRMDGAWPGSINDAIKKAKTANYFDMNSVDLRKLSQPSDDLYGIEISNDGFISLPGGVLLKQGA